MMQDILGDCKEISSKTCFFTWIEFIMSSIHLSHSQIMPKLLYLFSNYLTKSGVRMNDSFCTKVLFYKDITERNWQLH